MSCTISTPERIEALLVGTLDPTSAQLLRDHYASPCEACLEQLESIDGERILRALAGPAAALEAREAERMFEAALASTRSGLVIAIEPRRARPAAFALRFAPVALAAGLVLFLVRDRSPPSEGLKGPSVASIPSVELMGFRGQVIDGVPTVRERLEDGNVISSSDHVLFRYKLEHPALTYWVIEHGRTREVIFEPPEDAQPTPAGEHELAAGGKALALDPAPYAPSFRVVVLACGERIERDHLLRIKDDDVLSEKCGRSALTLEVDEAK